MLPLTASYAEQNSGQRGENITAGGMGGREGERRLKREGEREEEGKREQMCVGGGGGGRDYSLKYLNQTGVLLY